MSLNPDKTFYSIGELAAHFGLNESNLRFWESQFSEISPRKNARGVRYYSKKDVENISLLYFLLKERGMTIEGAKKSLKSNRENTIKTHQVVERLKSIKSELLAIIEEL